MKRIALALALAGCAPDGIDPPCGGEPGEYAIYVTAAVDVGAETALVQASRDGEPVTVACASAGGPCRTWGVPGSTGTFDLTAWIAHAPGEGELVTETFSVEHQGCIEATTLSLELTEAGFR